MAEKEENVPAWKAFEDVKIREQKEKEEKLALLYLIEYLDKNQIVFEKDINGNLINIPSFELISRKEIIKLLLLTKGRLGIQFFNGEIGIYKLHSKISR